MHVSNWVWGGRCEYPDVGNQGIWVIRSGHQDIIKPVRVSCWGFFFPFFFLPARRSVAPFPVARFPASGQSRQSRP